MGVKGVSISSMLAGVTPNFGDPALEIELTEPALMNATAFV